METTNPIFYKAYCSRDPRFDGVFYVGVTSTGIYCRPICPAKTPKEENCRFFKSAEAAEKVSFRPCLRCRPELAPGNAPVDDAHRLANLIIHRLKEGMLDEEESLEEIAHHFNLSSRHIRRIIQQEFGVSPMELLLTRRLLLAKQLLSETSLSITEIAFSSGFSSLRRFNDAFSKRYGMPPSRVRKGIKQRFVKPVPSETITLQLNYRPPFDWEALLTFLKARSLKGVEYIWDGNYARTVQLGQQRGWVCVRHAPEKNALYVEVSQSLLSVLPALLGRLRNLFDLSARPDSIATQLGQDPLLAEALTKNPGLRVPGAFDGFELAVRAVLGQQITVKAATTFGGRVVKAFGECIETPYPELYRLAPTPQRMASLRVEELTALGIIQARAKTIITLAEEMASNRLKIEAGLHPEETIKQLIALPGIGKWTAHYIAMRALRWPDAFPKEDIVLRKKLGGVSASQAEILSQAWRPWRSYATLYLWLL
ncbi:putative DNA-3-methyladenine glycosidase II [Candidatus Protochlamydia naegleriophila]|uniref:DNA-3-methyladenine glycosylase II n=1 Tax=Candidatus Protochlamydia naegleriophila TaxID=389348 RepID=A0A0U5JHG8_9BACT|nr:AlkA N-terminal domain-containing protein [Candidatus Protochlamydia naegleriophila]CUI18050.1 putative DNA-3-methyladenine glycosidase II [Candidatus Protochlamydia naegleriophila]